MKNFQAPGDSARPKKRTIHDISSVDFFFGDYFEYFDLPGSRSNTDMLIYRTVVRTCGKLF